MRCWRPLPIREGGRTQVPVGATANRSRHSHVQACSRRSVSNGVRTVCASLRGCTPDILIDEGVCDGLVEGGRRRKIQSHFCTRRTVGSTARYHLTCSLLVRVGHAPGVLPAPAGVFHSPEFYQVKGETRRKCRAKVRLPQGNSAGWNPAVSTSRHRRWGWRPGRRQVLPGFFGWVCRRGCLRRRR